MSRLEDKLAEVEAIHNGHHGEPTGFELAPVDFERVRLEGVPEIEMLLPPYVPRGASVQLVGPTEVAKSMWAQHQAAIATRLGFRVAYFQGENPFPVEFARWERLKPDHEGFRLFDAVGLLDLADPAQAEWFLQRVEGFDLVVVDTWSSFWPGEDNEATLEWERQIVTPIKSRGSTLLTIHHEGFKQPFSPRGGATAGRGGSAQGQKADVVLDFDPGKEQHEFVIRHGKGGRFSPGGVKEPDRSFRVIDTADGGLDIEDIGEYVPEGMLEVAEHLLKIIRREAGNRTTTRRYLTAAATEIEHGGKESVMRALDFLRQSDDVIVQKKVKVIGRNGKETTGDLWLPAP
jgi:hypothetical protein